MDNLVETFCNVDDFCKLFIPQWEQTLIEGGSRKRRRKGRMNPSEIMTAIIGFYQSHFRDFKNYYLCYVTKYLKSYFPQSNHLCWKND